MTDHAHGLAYAGLGLDTPAITARDLSGALHIPERVGENVPAPGRHGTVRAARKRYGGRLAPFEIVVRDCAPDGSLPADPDAQLDANLDELGAALAVDSGLLVHTLPGGQVRQILAEARAAVEGARNRAGTQVVVGVVFESHEAFWRSPDPVSVSLTLTSGAVTALPGFAPCTAPIDDAVLTFGPGPAPTLTDPATGTFIAYDAPIGAGRTLVLDCAARRGYGTGGLVFDRRLLRTTPGEGWFALAHTRTGAPAVRLDLNGGGTMNVTLAARLSWVFG